MDLSSIFGLMVVAGFPQVWPSLCLIVLHCHCVSRPSQLPREGCVLSKPTDDGPARGVVTSLFPDRQRGVVVDLQSRTPQQQVVGRGETSLMRANGTMLVLSRSVCRTTVWRTPCMAALTPPGCPPCSHSSGQHCDCTDKVGVACAIM